ncbi:phosphoglycerate mutase-like protein [Piedraia hortae CBS 480.64]|uniref:Phosphoglycerate mutase-like protein n=1 Tax=Piedraia hortae CBS 480.64 TaxID=1314780 RepID=A0A6A7BPU7_9PEZI|nr:phosphoglycerate mutase-like protein [Piedraia hortae CBS 480.64]
MAPNSRLILTRHAQAEHNVDLDYSIPDAPLTKLGRKQASALADKIKALQDEADLVVTSPLKRTLQTTHLGYSAAISRLGGLGNVICLPQAQESNNLPCDTGSSRTALEASGEFVGFDLSPLTEEWNSKQGFYAPDAKSIANRARWVRQWLRDRPEKTIVLVAHGDILRNITAGPNGPSEWQWRNTETRVYHFDEKFLDGECFLDHAKAAVAAGGYAPTSSEMDL